MGLTEGISLAQLLGWQAIASGATADEVMDLKLFLPLQRVRENGVFQEERVGQHPLKELRDGTFFEACDAVEVVAPRWTRPQRPFGLAARHQGDRRLRLTFSVPEPAELLMLVAGVGLLGVLYRVRGRRRCSG